MLAITNDIKIKIAIGASCSAKKWANKTMKWSEFAEQMSQTKYTEETYAEFISMTKDQQCKVKDVGGFVGGYLEGGSRKKGNVSNRQLVCLDIDFSTNEIWTDFILQYDCAALIHGTHKHCAQHPRHRLIIPLDREVTTEEYQAISRKIAEDLDINLFDQSTFDTNRLMFWPSTPRDMEYYFEYQDGPMLSANRVLKRYNDWRNTSEWPVAKGIDAEILKQGKTQENPLEKEGVVGCFCRTYDIHEAIAKFLNGTYERVDDRRYTYIPGSTAGGMVTYEDMFAFSHHGTDPSGGMLLNAFDLVRVHKFANLDNNDNPRASFYAMEKLALDDAGVRAEIARIKLKEARDAFGLDYIDVLDAKNEEESDDIAWMQELEVDKKGNYTNSATNLKLVFNNDRYLKGAFAYNEFDNKRYVKKSLPWRKVVGCDYVRDCDYAGIRSYIECCYGIVANTKVDDALALEFEKTKFHPIVEYLETLKWDGRKRIDNLLIDYFGAARTAYSQQAIRKMLVGAVARVYEPGTKFDTCLILVGPQGCYKSTFIRKLGKGWTSDTFVGVSGKESFEQLQGNWLIEIAELSGLRKADVEATKHFLSKVEDNFRPAYARCVETFKRQCVFFGTTNASTFLRDETGNRRFMPVEVRLDKVTKSVMKDLTDKVIDQVWAEATALYKEGEVLYLEGEARVEAEIAQKEHVESDERQGVVEEFCNMLLPERWEEWGLFERRQWLENPVAQKNATETRNYISVIEIWCECFGRPKAELDIKASREIKAILTHMEGWELSPTSKNLPIYGRQRGFRRVQLATEYDEEED